MITDDGTRMRVALAAAVLALVPVSWAADQPAPGNGEAGWPQAGRDAQRTGYSPDTVLPPYKPAWNVSFFPDRTHTCAGVVVADNRVFIGTKGGVVHALDLLDKGKELWSFQCGGPILHSLAVAGGKVIAAALDGFVYALNAADGAPAWKTDTGFGISAAPLVVESSVFIGNREGAFFRLALADGKVTWKTEFGAPVLQTAAYNGGRVYVGAEDMHMRALSVKDGAEVWRSGKLQGQSFKDYWPVVHKGYVIVRPQVVTIDFDMYTGFPPLVWGFWDSPLFKEATQAYPQGKPIPEEIRGAEDRLAAFFTENPSYREMHFLKEADGTVGFVPPVTRSGVLGGAVPPPCVMSDGLLTAPVGCGFDVEKQRWADIWPPGGPAGTGTGGGDETVMASCGGPIVFVQHYNGWGRAFDTRTRTWNALPFPARMLSNLVNGGSQTAVSGTCVVHVAHGTVSAWTGEVE